VSVAIVDYAAGNRTSVQNALRFLGADYTVASEPAALLASERVIFPGVGEARAAMDDLARRGMDDALRRVSAEGRPLLGICIGAQVLLQYSAERDTTCLGLVPGKAVAFPEPHPGDGMKVPHMGWNQVQQDRPHALFDGIPDGGSFYFVHSFYPQPADDSIVLGSTEYGVRFASVYAAGNLAAVQFHAEKSGRHGLRLLANFLEWDGA
jgi:glutamine amidotransferase